MAKHKKSKLPACTTPRTKLDLITDEVIPGRGRLRAHVTGTPKGTKGKLRVTWILDVDDQSIARASSPRTYNYSPSKESWDTALIHLRNIAVAAFREDYLKTNNVAIHQDPSTVPAGYAHYFTELGDELKKPRWAESTWSNYRPAILRICTMLDNLDTVTVASLSKMKETYVQEVAASKNSKGMRSAERHVNNMFVAADYCLTLMISQVNEVAGAIVLAPVPIWDVLGRQRHWQLEAAKWIPEEVITRLAECLFRLVDNGLVMGIALMMCMGLRTSESVAVLMGELQLRDGFVVYNVQHQGPDRNPILKTKSAYRVAIGGRMLYDLLIARHNKLKDLGYSDEEIALMPAVSMPNNPKQHIDIRYLSIFARELLFACQHSAESYTSAVKLMAIEPDPENDDHAQKSVSAYIFRRNFATMVCNICDLMPLDGIEDYLLGHVLQTPLSVDPKNPDVQKVIATRLDRWVIHPEHTTHPLFSSIPLSLRTTTVDLGEHNAYRFTATEDIELQLHIETAHPNGRLFVTTTGQIPLSRLKRAPGNTLSHEELATRPTILMPLSRDVYRQCIFDAQQIDFSNRSSLDYEN